MLVVYYPAGKPAVGEGRKDWSRAVLKVFVFILILLLLVGIAYFATLDADARKRVLVKFRFSC